MSELTAAKIEATKLELNNLKSSRAHEKTLHQTEMLRLRLKMVEITKLINRGGYTNTTTTNHLTTYYAALAEDQDTSTPTSIRQRQAFLCQTLHQYEAKSRLLEKVKEQCTRLVSSVRLNMQSLEDECIEIEKKLSNEIEVLRDNISECKSMNESVVRRQIESLRELRLQNDVDVLSATTDSMEEEELTPSVREDESVNAELRFNTSLSQSISRISMELKNEFALPKDEKHAATKSARWAEVIYTTQSKLSIRSSFMLDSSSRSISNLSELFSHKQNKGITDHGALPSFFDSFSSLHAERLSSSVKYTPVNPVA